MEERTLDTDLAHLRKTGYIMGPILILVGLGGESSYINYTIAGLGVFTLAVALAINKLRTAKVFLLTSIVSFIVAIMLLVNGLFNDKVVLGIVCCFATLFGALAQYKTYSLHKDSITPNDIGIE